MDNIRLILKATRVVLEKYNNDESPTKHQLQFIRSKYSRVLEEFLAMEYDQKRVCIQFMCLARMLFVLEYPRISKETECLVTDSVETNPDFVVSKCMKEGNDTPIICFKQSESVDAVKLLSKKMCFAEDLTEECRILFVRMGGLTCEAVTLDILDIEDMRQPSKLDNYYFVSESFKIYCAIYFRAILGYYRNVKLHESKFSNVCVCSNETIETFFEKEICAKISSPMLLQIFRRVCVQAYTFPGDKEWYEYKYPNSPYIFMEALEKIRPLLAKEYRLECSQSIETIIYKTKVNKGLTGQCCRLFVLGVFGHYLDVIYHIRFWEKRVVFYNNELNSRELLVKMRRGDLPLIINNLSQFCVYWRGQTWKSKNIYTILNMWVSTIRNENREFRQVVAKVKNYVTAKEKS